MVSRLKNISRVQYQNTIQGMLETMMEETRLRLPLWRICSQTRLISRSWAGCHVGKRSRYCATDRRCPRAVMLFIQRPGIEIELWVEKNDWRAASPSADRRPIVLSRANRALSPNTVRTGTWPFIQVARISIGTTAHGSRGDASRYMPAQPEVREATRR